jgi:hypothetical protein
MTHDLFGRMKYRDADACWLARAPLARFAAHGACAPEPPAFDGDDQPDPAEAERERKRQARAARKADRLARGLYPVRIADPDEVGPSPPQEAAFRFLTQNEPAVLDAVLARVWESFRSFYDDEHWRQGKGLRPAGSVEELRGRFALVHVEIAREHRGGLSHLVSTADSDWQDGHGLVVVYSPDTREAAWTSYDILHDLLESDEPAGEEYVPTPHDELVEAVLAGDEERARELAAAGADVNALAPDENPPLCLAVDQLDVESVRRLLAFGADPNLADPQTKKTPLKLAKRMYREMGFGPARPKDALLNAMLTLARDAAGKQFEEFRTKLEEIMRLLEVAGGK